MRGGKLFGGGFSHIGDGQRVNPAGERRGLGALQRFQNFRGVFLPEDARLVVRAEIQSGELLFGEIEQVERFLDQAAFD